MRVEHQFDEAYWCVWCGAGYKNVVEGTRPKECEPGVRGITHLVRGRFIAKTVEAVLEKLYNGPRPS